MNMFLKLALPVFILLSSLGLSASVSASGVGFADLQRALNEIDEGAKAKASLKKEFEKKQKLLNVRQEKLKKAKENFDAGQMLMKAEVKQQKMQEMQKEMMEVQQLYYAMQQELAKREQEVTAGIFQKMGLILDKMGKEQGLDMIVDKAAVLYAKSQHDLTNELIRRYNKTYKVKKRK